MLAFTISTGPNGTLIARNAHLRGEQHEVITATPMGVVTGVLNIDHDILLNAGILAYNESGAVILRTTTDSSDLARRFVWGQLTRDAFCACAEEPSPSDWEAFERHDSHGEYTGEHGFACPTCKGILQVG